MLVYWFLLGTLRPSNGQMSSLFNGTASRIFKGIVALRVWVIPSWPQPFRFSKKLRGLTHTSEIWDSPKRVTGQEFLNYLSRWFCPTQLLMNVNGQALLILDTI